MRGGERGGGGGRGLDDAKLSYALGWEVGELVRVEVVVGVSGVGRGQGDAGSVVEGDGGGGEKAVGNLLRMEVLHSLCRETMTVSSLILLEIGHSCTMLCCTIWESSKEHCRSDKLCTYLYWICLAFLLKYTEVVT